MSKNTDFYQFTSTSSSSNNNSHKRLPAHQHFLSSSSDFNTPSPMGSTTRNDSPSPQSLTSPIVSDVCAGSQNGIRSTSTAMKTKDITSPNGNHLNNKYAFTLEFSPPVTKTKKEHYRTLQSELHSFDMASNNEEDLHSPFELDVPLCEIQPIKKIQNDFLIDRMLKDDNNSDSTSQHRSPNQSSYTTVLTHGSPVLTPSSDQHDIDALSDAGTYIIEDDLDIARDDEPESEPEIEIHHEVQEHSSLSPASTSSSRFKRYATTKRSRHGTFEIHGIVPSSPSTAPQSINRPVVDSNISAHDLSSPSSSPANSSSSSSLRSLPTESDNSIRKEPEGASLHTIDDKSSIGLVYARQRPTTLLQYRPSTPPQSQIKPAECFVISPTFEGKPFPTTISNGSRRKLETTWKPKPTISVVPTRDTTLETPSKKSPSSPPLSVGSNQSDTDRYSFRLQQKTRPQESKQQPSSANLKPSLQNSEYSSTSKSSVRPHISINDQTYPSPFQRNSSARQTMPANIQYSRPMSSSTITTANKYHEDDEDTLSSHPSLTKVFMNKSFALRRQRSNLVPSTAKPVQQQQQQQAVVKALATRQLLKPTTSTPAPSMSASNSTGQTNRAVELRRARAQAKIEELAQRTRHQLQKNEQHNDIMSASWHSNASSTSKKDHSYLRSTPRSTKPTTNQNTSAQKQDMLKTRTISSSSHHRSSSASPNPLGEMTKTKAVKYRKSMVSSVTDEAQYQQMNGSTYSEGERCDTLRDDGQRLAIKLIQLSSGILAKLKPNNTAIDNDSNVRELEQLVDQLQTVNRTLSNIDASLIDPTSDESLI